MAIDFSKIYGEIAKVNSDEKALDKLKSVFGTDLLVGFRGETHTRLADGRLFPNNELNLNHNIIKPNSYFVQVDSYYTGGYDHIALSGTFIILNDYMENESELKEIKSIIDEYDGMVKGKLVYTTILEKCGKKFPGKRNNHASCISSLDDLKKFIIKFEDLPRGKINSLGNYYNNLSKTLNDLLGNRGNTSINFREEGCVDRKDTIPPEISNRVCRVKKVFTFENQNDTRLALLVNSNHYGLADFVLANPGDTLYDYLDEGRLLVRDIDDIKAVFDINITPEYLIDNGVNVKSLCDAYIGSRTNSIKTITPADIPKYRDVVKVRQVKQASIRDKMLEKIKLLKEKNLAISGLKLEDDCIKYDIMTVNFSCETTKKCYQVGLRNLVYRISENTIDTGAILNFNSLFNEFKMELAAVLEKWKSSRGDKTASMCVNGVEIQVSKNTKETEKTSSTRYFINDIRINHEELIPCIDRVLCYTSQEDYNQFLSIVSKCSLETHKYLDAGLEAVLSIDSQLNYKMKFAFKRIKHKNYIKIGDDYILIKNLRGFANAIKRLSRTRPRRYGSKNSPFQQFCELFDGDKKSFFNKNEVSNEMLITVINEGVKRKEDAIKKSEKLLKDTLKIVGAKLVNDLNIQGKVIHEAYVLESKAGNTYAVFEQGNEYDHYGGCQVYKKVKNGENYTHVCIVDRSLGDQVGKDKLVNRLFALKNDTMVADKITTLAGHV